MRFPQWYPFALFLLGLLYINQVVGIGIVSGVTAGPSSSGLAALGGRV